MLAGLDAEEGDLSQVEGDDAVLRVEVVPAALLELLAKVLEVGFGEAGGDDLPTLEQLEVGLAAMAEILRVERGWRKATRLSRMPTRGSESISSIPVAAIRTRAPSMSSTA